MSERVYAITKTDDLHRLKLSRWVVDELKLDKYGGNLFSIDANRETKTITLKLLTEQEAEDIVHSW